MLDFSTVGTTMSFVAKLHKHQQAGDCDKLKDYICQAFDLHNPMNAKDHPCYDAIDNAINFMTFNGWKVVLMDWKDIGKQIVLVSPSNQYYHSNFKHV